MVDSGSAFRPYLAGVIMDLFRLLHAEWNETESLVYITYPREAAASMCLAVIFWQIASGVPWSGVKAAPASVRALVLAVVRP